MPEQSNFSNVKACVFDAYGTLFDVHSAVGRHQDRFGDQADEISALWRRKQLEYTWLRSLMQRHADFWQVTQDALDYSLETYGISDDGLRKDLLDAYLSLECYPEVKDTLKKIRDLGLKSAILSNGAPNMLDAGVKSSGLSDLLDDWYSVERIGIFKPDPRVYQIAVDELGIAKEEIVFLSSNSWDAVGAASFGLRVAWVNRFDQRKERLPHGADVELKDLSGLIPLLTP